MEKQSGFAQQIRCLISTRYRRAFRSLRFLPKVNYEYVIDAGANRGSFSDAFLQLHHPKRLVLVEPLAELATDLTNRFRDQNGITVLPTALAKETGQATFEVNEFDYSSSLLHIDSRNSQWFGRSLKVAKTVTVPTISLPDLMEQEKLPHLDLLKMDLQGAERLVLTGGESVLDRVRVIFSEVLFERLYDGCWVFGEMDQFLTTRGFKLCSLSNIVHATTGDLLQANAIYRQVKNT